MSLRPHQRRLLFILLFLTCLGGAAGLALYALRDNVSLFFTPSQVVGLQKTNPALVAGGKSFRLGGLVKKGSLVRASGDDTSFSFTVTDEIADISVTYNGILPDLFREGQGVVARGSLDATGVFTADEMLARHDENYMPPEVAKGLEDAARKKAE